MNKEELKSVDLEDLIAETEQKIMSNDYYQDCDVIYKNLLVHLRIRPMSQKRFTKLMKNKKLSPVEANTEIILDCVLNKETNEPFTRKQVNEIFEGGLAAVVAMKCAEVSGLDPDSLEKDENF